MAHGQRRPMTRRLRCLQALAAAALLVVPAMPSWAFWYLQCHRLITTLQGCHDCRMRCCPTLLPTHAPSGMGSGCVGGPVGS